MVQADNSIAIYLDNQLVSVIPKDSYQQNEIMSKTNDFTVSTRNIQKLIKECITYLVGKQNSQEKLVDYWFYNNRIKNLLKKEPLYNQVMDPKLWKLKSEAYGINYRLNQANQKEI